MITEYLNKIVLEKRIPGISVALIDDKATFFNAGYTDYQNIIKVTENTLYDLASLTKVVSTTTLILKLIEDNYFELDTKVKDIIPGFKYDNVSILNLLTHTSGLPADDKNYKNCNSKEQMWSFTLQEELIFEPSSKVEYSDFNYIILGKIIEKYKNSIEEYANEIIFKPLGMNDTIYNPILKNRKQDCAPTEVTIERGIIQGEVHDGKAFKLNGLSGNAGLFSCSKDLSKFVRMMLDNNGSILKKETINKLKQSYTNSLNLSRTIGWFYNDPSTPVYGISSSNALWHTGFAGGSILIDFDNNKGVVILTNRVHPSRNNDISDIRSQIHKLLYV